MSTKFELLQGYTVYEYTFLDDLSFVQSPATFYEAVSVCGRPDFSLDEAVGAVRERFLAAGWEGDGSIGVIWLPPFVDVGVEDTWGTYIWHVKQRNNGVSFLLSPVHLDFKRLQAQDEEHLDGIDRGAPTSIVQHDADALEKAVTATLSELARGLREVEKFEDAAVANQVKTDLLAHKQGMLVHFLNRFLDDCYLRFLIEAMNGNRARLKLRKARVQLSPPREPSDEYGEDASSWVTVQGVISDMWKAYKFEPYKVKIDMLFRSVDFSPVREIAMRLAVHVSLRNCIQHHGGKLDRDSLQQLGLTEIKVRTQSGDAVVTQGKAIVLSEEELQEFGNALTSLASNFSRHVWDRVPIRDHIRVSDSSLERGPSSEH